MPDTFTRPAPSNATAPSGVDGASYYNTLTNAFQFREKGVWVGLGEGGGGLLYKGAVDCSTSPEYPPAGSGDFYKVSVAGKIGGGAGIEVEVEDVIVCLVNNGGGTQSAVGTSWAVQQGNVLVPTEVEAVAGSDNTKRMTALRTAQALTGRLAVVVHAATPKATPAGDDEIGIADSAASFALKKVTWAGIKTALKTYFDTLYSTFSGAYADLSGKPTLGTAAALNVAASGNAAVGEIVLGSDTRMSNARAPTTHGHVIDDTTGLVSALAGKADTSHTHDGRYYTETEIDALLASKTDTGHNHDGRYYTETEIDALLASKTAVTVVSGFGRFTIGGTTYEFPISTIP